MVVEQQAVDRQPGGHVPACELPGGTRRRRAAAIGLALGGATLVTSGALAGWNATSGVSSGSLSAATPAVQMVDANGGQFNTDIANLLPGDFFHRYVDLKNTGTVPTTFSGPVVATGALASALRAQVDVCSVPWSPSATPSCPGSLTAVAGEQGLSPATLTPVYGTIAPAQVAHVRYRFSMAPDAPAGLMGASGGISVSVSGDVVGGQDRTAG